MRILVRAAQASFRRSPRLAEVIGRRLRQCSVSRVARWRIRRRGGQLWIWGAPVGDSADELTRTSYSRPDSVEFEYVDHDGLILWFQRGFPIDTLTIGWTPVTGIDVTWIGTVAAGGG
jgi:hypothetical protein